MPQIDFTDRKIASLKPPGTGQVDYYDTRATGLGLRVSHGGTKTWFGKYFVAGKQRRKSIGQYPAVKLAEARQKLLAWKNDVANGVDPVLREKTERAVLSFADLAALYIERHAKPKKRSWREDQRILDKYCRPWRRRPAQEIGRADVVELLHDIASGGSPIMANRVLACVCKLFNWAIRNGHLQQNPAHMVDAPGREAVRERIYNDDEIRRLWAAFGMRAVTGQVFRMCLATGQRLREVAGMRWDEIDGDLWTLPGARTKNRRTHLVPLNAVAIDILAARHGVSDAFVFASPNKPDRPVEHFGKAAEFVKAASGIADFRAHDLRRTVATNMTALGISQFIVGRLLNHTPEGVTHRHYDRYEYLKEKQQAAHAWEQMLSDMLGSSS